MLKNGSYGIGGGFPLEMQTLAPIWRRLQPWNRQMGLLQVSIFAVVIPYRFAMARQLSPATTVCWRRDIYVSPYAYVEAILRSSAP